MTMNPFEIFGIEPVLEKLSDAKLKAAIRNKYRDLVAHAALKKSVSLDAGDGPARSYVDTNQSINESRIAATILLDPTLAKQWLDGDRSFISNIQKSFDKEEKDEFHHRKISKNSIEISHRSHNVKISKSRLVIFPDMSLKEIDVRICWAQENMLQRFFKKDCVCIPNIVSLRLYSNNIHMISKHISRLVRMQSLWLHDNFLSYIPDSLCDVTSLTELQLHKNPLIVLMPRTFTLTRLQKLTWDQKFVTNILPEVVEQGSQSVMKYLKLLAENRQSEGFLCLENLGLTTLPEWTRDTLPKYLIKCTENATFRWNSLRDISTLAIAPVLRSICLSYNKMMAFPTGMETLLSLQVLDLSFNQISSIDSVVLFMTQLQVLDLKNNFVTQILLSLSTLTTLKRVDLQNNMITILPLWWAENWLQNVIEISWNQIKEPDLMALGRSQSEIDQVLKKLYRSHLSGSLCITSMSWENIPSMFLFSGLTSLDCSSNIISQWPDSLVICKKLKSLAMMRNNLSVVPDGVALLTNITYLDLSWNYIRKVSKRIASCVNIETVILSKNAMPKLPSTIGMIGCKLNSLNVSGGGLMEITSSIGLLIGLLHLDASRNAISILPQSICMLSKLQTLNLSHNFLKFLPQEIGDLQELIILNLSKNVLSDVPSSICNCTCLRSLFLEKNNLARLPKEICKITRLCHINVSENRILLRFGGIGSTPFLHELSSWKIKHGLRTFYVANSTKRLRLEHTGLTAIPVEVLDLIDMSDISLRGIPCSESLVLFCNWTTLTRLDLRETGVFEAPSYLGKCKGLKELFLDFQEQETDSDLVTRALKNFISIRKLVQENEPSQQLNVAPTLLAFHDIAEKSELSGVLQLKGLNISAFPDFFFKMGKTLLEIDISRNRIVEIPNSALDLVFLKILRLNNNLLTSIPSSFAVCTRLTLLNVSHNQLTHIPFAINGMVELRHMFLQSNQIMFLDGPFEGCTKLISLNVSQNLISDISSKLSECRLLQNIDLSFNNLENMVFLGLLSLNSLSLSNNNIKTIERSYLQCTALRRLDLSNNMIDNLIILLSSGSISQLVVTNNLIREIPDEARLAVSLVELHASSNRIEAVSENLFLCPSITVVDLKNNSIVFFCAKAEQCDSLSFLDISGNKGIQLSPSLGYLRNEVEFVFQVNDLDWPNPSSLSENTWYAVKRYLQKCFHALKDDALDLRGFQLSGNLRVIPLDRNGLCAPAHMFDKRNCKLLTLERNLLTQIPEDVYSLNFLIELNVSNQAIEEIPLSVFAMPYLQCFNARHTAVIDIPQSVSFCTSLKYLLLGCNNIRQLPENIFACPALEVLDIGRCPISKIPTFCKSCVLKIIVLNQDEFDDFFRNSLDNAFCSTSISSRLLSLDDMNMVVRRTKGFLTFLNRWADESKAIDTTSLRKNAPLSLFFDLCNYNSCPEYLAMLNHIRSIKVISLSFNNFGISFETLSRGPWDNVQELSLVDCKMEQLPASSGNVWSSLTKLSLARNNFKVFPPQMLLMQSLIDIDFSDNPLLYIPITAGSLKKLKKIHTYNCPLNGNSPILPLARAETVAGYVQSLWFFHKNRIFDLCAQKLEEIPRELRSKAYCTLIELRLQDNLIRSWNPNNFTHLVAIRYLDVSINRLDQIDVSYMKEIEYINVSFNELSELPKGISTMAALSTLNASENNISMVPDTLSACSSLTHLKLSRNQITKIGSKLTSLRKLETIELDGNRLETIPKFCSGQRLRLLCLDDNPISNVPVWLCKSRSLNFLSIRNANIQYLPCELGYTLQLETLLYEGNPLDSPPMEIRRSGPFLSMKFLEMLADSLLTGKLNLKEMLISQIPAELEMFDPTTTTPWCVKMKHDIDGTDTFCFSKLVTLDISFNKIRDLDTGHLHLFTCLMILNMESNNIKKLPNFIGNFRSLVSLSVKNNALQSLWPVTAMCTTLEHLDASFNSLQKIDTSVRYMHKLITLHVQKNQIQDLPIEIGCLTALKTLTADQTTVDNSVPSTVSGQGTISTVVFLSKILRSEETAILELKNAALFSVPKAISKLQGTIKIDLSQNNLDLDAISNFLLILESLEQLRQKELSKKSADEQLQSAIQQTLFAGKNNVKTGFAALPILLSLQTLVLSSNRLMKFPMVVSKIKQLTSLDLTDNEISVLPANIRQLKTLITLRLSFKCLEYPPIHVAYPTETSLESESVDLENFLRFVTATVPDENKRVLKVNDYRLKFIPELWLLEDPFVNVQTISFSDNLFDLRHKNDANFFEKLVDLTSLDLSGNRILEIPCVFSNLTKLKFLNIARNCLSEIPQLLMGITNLESLSMDNNKVAIIPKGIISLIRLNFLSLKGNPLIDLPPIMCNLSEVLQTLLVDDTLNFPPKEVVWEGTAAIFEELSQVYYSMMSTSQMLIKQGYFQVPQMLTEYTRMTQLDLSKNIISAIPDFFSKLVHLETLNFSRNRLYHIGNWLPFTTALENLDVSHNKLSVLSSCIGISKSLKYVNASFNEITTVSRAVMGSKSLLALDIMENAGPITWMHFEGLKQRMDKAKRKNVFMSSVEDIQAQNSTEPETLAFASYVWCSSQPFWSVKNEFGAIILKDVSFELILDSLNEGITNEKSEIMCSKKPFRVFKKISSSSVFCRSIFEWGKNRKEQFQITENSWFLPNVINSLNARLCRFFNNCLPAALIRSAEMSILDMSECMIEKIPRSIGLLRSLRILKLVKNRIVDIPQELGYCINLQSVDISQNCIKIFPNLFAGLTKLKEFSMNDNALVAFPESFSKLSALKALSFAKNCVAEMGNFIGLDEMVEMDGSSNMIESMDALYKCVSLEKVYLPDNKINKISEEIQSMTNLCVLDLSKNCIESLPTQFANLTKLKSLDLRENMLTSMLPPGIFSCHMNGSTLRRYLNVIKELRDCLCLDLTFFDYKEVPKFALTWTTKRQKARNRWMWAISKAKNIVMKSLASTLQMTMAEIKATETEADDVTKILGDKKQITSTALDKSQFNVNDIDSRMDSYYGRTFGDIKQRKRRIPWCQIDGIDQNTIEMENPDLVPIIKNATLSNLEKFEQIVETMLLKDPFFLSIIDFSWYYSNQKIPDGGKMTTQGPLRIHGILILWLRDVLDLNSFVWADIVDGNDAVLLYEWTKLADLPFFAQFLMRSTKCLQIIVGLKYLPANDVLNHMAIALLNNHKEIIKKRAYRDAYTAAIEMGIADIQLVLMDNEEVIKRYGKPLLLSEGIDEDWDAVVGLEERTAFLRTDESAVVAYSKFQEEFFLLRVLISTDDFTPLPKFRKFSFISESTRLFMFGNHLDHINPLISCLHLLVEVNLCGNELKDLPPMMKHLVQLQHVNLSNNRFQFFPEVLANLGPNLLTLTLAWNSIKVIPSMVSNFSRLQELNLSCNMITAVQALAELRTLTTLHLASNNIARMISLIRMSSLTELTLNHNPVNLFPASFGSGTEQLKVIAIDSWTRAGLPPCYMKHVNFWFFTPPLSEEKFERQL